jgi:4-hydroxy-2-oxoheptanedioate aldolase
VAETFDAAVELIARTAAAAGVAAGIHTHSGTEARQRLSEGFTFATVSSDLDHLQAAAAMHLSAARG